MITFTQTSDVYVCSFLLSVAMVVDLEAFAMRLLLTNLGRGVGGENGGGDKPRLEIPPWSFCPAVLISRKYLCAQKW